MSESKIIIRILKSIRRRLKRRIRERNVMMQTGSDRCNGSGFGAAEKRLEAKECEWSLKSGKGKGMDLFLESPERNAALSIP